MTLNANQKPAVFFGAVVVAAMLILPPWVQQMDEDRLPVGYSFIWGRPSLPGEVAIHYSRLFVQLAGVTAFTAGWLILLRGEVKSDKGGRQAPTRPVPKEKAAKKGSRKGSTSGKKRRKKR